MNIEKHSSYEADLTAIGFSGEIESKLLHKIEQVRVLIDIRSTF
jgi:hypothetical protein